MQAIDLRRVSTYPISRRKNLVHLSDLVKADDPLPLFESRELDRIVSSVITARGSGRPVIWSMGAHVIKCGLSLLLIDLLERGIVTHVAGNGAVSIHDFELALVGATSEDVATSIEDGTFGMAEETGALMHRAIRAGARDGLGYGASIGRFMDQNPDLFPHRDISVLWNAYRRGIPATIHVTIGADIIHQHPSADFGVLGAASGRDFRIYAGAVSQLEGGVFLNFGSAVTGPEVFLKSVTIVRNLGHKVEHITTGNFDLIPMGDDRGDVGYDDPIYYYRPRKNIVIRPTSLGGSGFHVAGDHKLTIPNLHRRVVEALGSLPLRSETCCEGLGKVASVLNRLLERAPELESSAPDIARAFRALRLCFAAGGTLFLGGNGGSMADALHISGELLKSFARQRAVPDHVKRRLSSCPDGELLVRNLDAGLRAIVLGANPSLASAVANDMPDRGVSLAQELFALARPGDAFLGISTSGDAHNVACAAQVGRALGLTVLGLTGAQGGLLADLADVAIKVPAERTDRIQELHVKCYHALCEMLEKEFFDGGEE